MLLFGSRAEDDGENAVEGSEVAVSPHYQEDTHGRYVPEQ